MAEFKLPKNSTLTKGVTHKADSGAQNLKTFEIYRCHLMMMLIRGLTVSKLILIAVGRWCWMR